MINHVVVLFEALHLMHVSERQFLRLGVTVVWDLFAGMFVSESDSPNLPLKI